MSNTDADSLAVRTVALLVPYLSRAAERLETSDRDLLDFDRSGEALYKAIKAEVDSGSYAAQALRRLEDRPESQARRADLAEELTELIVANPEFATRLSDLTQRRGPAAGQDLHLSGEYVAGRDVTIYQALPGQSVTKPDVDWTTCSADPGCTGVPYGSEGSCFAHLDDQGKLDALLPDIVRSPTLDARGVVFSARLLRKILLAFPIGDGGRLQVAPFVQFEFSSFKGRAWMNDVDFLKDADFSRATFESIARFDAASFKGSIRFQETVFKDWVSLDTATIEGRLEFRDATFERPCNLGYITASQVDFDSTIFRGHLEASLNTSVLSSRRTQFLDGVLLRLSRSTASFEYTDFAAPSVVSDMRDVGNTSPTPRLLSLEGSDVGTLTLRNVDISHCRFLGSYHLDSLRLEGSTQFAHSPEKVSSALWRPLTLRPTKRQVIAEEYAWRANQHNWTGWAVPEAASGASDNSLPPNLDPLQIAGLYRALRKGREDSKDEPGAADFYYGEMEMRRHAAKRFSAERTILTLYWLISGYALRASRAFVALAFIILLGALIFATVGFESPNIARFVEVKDPQTGAVTYEQRIEPTPDYRNVLQDQFSKAVIFSAESATSLIRRQDRPLTRIGEWTQVVLRLLGPTLFGLAVLSLRGRVKR